MNAKELTVDAEALPPVVSRGGLVIALKRDQLLLACAVRGMSLEDLRLAAGLSRPTFQAAVRGKRVRPLTLLKLAQALKRRPILDEASLLLTGALPPVSRQEADDRERV